MIPESGNRFPDKIMVKQGIEPDSIVIGMALARQLAASPAVGTTVWQGY